MTSSRRFVLIGDAWINPAMVQLVREAPFSVVTDIIMMSGAAVRAEMAPAEVVRRLEGRPSRLPRPTRATRGRR